VTRVERLPTTESAFLSGEAGSVGFGCRSIIVVVVGVVGHGRCSIIVVRVIGHGRRSVIVVVRVTDTDVVALLLLLDLSDTDAFRYCCWNCHRCRR
jgi:hypothetical protein